MESLAKAWYWLTLIMWFCLAWERNWAGATWLCWVYQRFRAGACEVRKSAEGLDVVAALKTSVPRL